MGTTRVVQTVVRVEDQDGVDAADALIDTALESSDVSDPDFAFLFCSPQFAVEELVERLGDRLSTFDAGMIGGTTSGEISKEGSTFGTAVMLLVETDEIDFYTGHADDVHGDPVKAGRKAVQRTVPDDFVTEGRYQGIFTIMSGLTASKPGVEFNVLQGISSALGTTIPVTGGSSGDDMALDHTNQFLNDTVFEDAVVLVAMDSALPIRVGQAHGMNSKIDTGVITDVEGTVIKTINGEPAAQFYADAIGTTVEDLKDTFEAASGIELQNVMRYALEKTLADEIQPGNLRLFTPIAVTDGGGLDITVEMDENRAIYVVEGEDEDIINAAADAFSHIADDETPIFGVLSDCTCRNMGMAPEDVQTEVEHLYEALRCPIVGMYGYGEIGGTDKEFCTFKNQTASGFVVTRPRQ